MIDFRIWLARNMKGIIIEIIIFVAIVLLLFNLNDYYKNKKLNIKNTVSNSVNNQNESEESNILFE